jgi:GTP-binding protein
MARAIVALVGRPNVGKSTLFNRLVGEQQAVVHETPGTTRDRLHGTVEWRGREFTLVDTGGLGLDESGDLQQSIIAQADAAIREADVVVFVTDVRAGPLASDVEVADRLRRTQKPLILVANKADSPRDRQRVTDFFELGLGEPLAVSSTQGIGTGDLLDSILEALPALPSPRPVEGDGEGEGETPDSAPIPVAIVGRPNVGKSSLLNSIVGEQRTIVNDVPGTTRDAIDTLAEHEGKSLLLIDTAGIRRRGRVERGIETYSVLRAMRAIERAEVAILVLDAHTDITAQDAHVGGYIHEAAKGCVIAVNKWDLVERSPDAGEQHLAVVRRELAFLPYAPVAFISAKSGLNVGRLQDRVLAVDRERERRIPTAQVNEHVREITTSHPLTERGKALKVLYATQASIRPPTFVLFVNEPALVHFSYRRYLENQLRRRFGFEGTGIRIVLRGRSES